jgi:hypothetical protein
MAPEALLFAVAGLLWLLLRAEALSSLTSSLLMQMGWTATKTITGDNYSPNSNSTTLKKSFATGTSAANAAVGGGDELCSSITSIAASGTATIDLTSMTEITGATGISLARLKGILIRLLSVVDDATNGTACNGITFGNAATNGFTSQAANRGFLGTAASVHDLGNGDAYSYGTARAAGVLVDATHKEIKVVNLDGAVAAKVEISIQGAST